MNKRNNSSRNKFRLKKKRKYSKRKYSKRKYSKRKYSKRNYSKQKYSKRNYSKQKGGINYLDWLWNTDTGRLSQQDHIPNPPTYRMEGTGDGSFYDLVKNGLKGYDPIVTDLSAIFLILMKKKDSNRTYELRCLFSHNKGGGENSNFFVKRKVGGPKIFGHSSLLDKVDHSELYDTLRKLGSGTKGEQRNRSHRLDKWTKQYMEDDFLTMAGVIYFDPEGNTQKIQSWDEGSGHFRPSEKDVEFVKELDKNMDGWSGGEFAKLRVKSNLLEAKKELGLGTIETRKFRRPVEEGFSEAPVEPEVEDMKPCLNHKGCSGRQYRGRGFIIHEWCEFEGNYEGCKKFIKKTGEGDFCEDCKRKEDEYQSDKKLMEAAGFW